MESPLVPGGSNKEEDKKITISEKLVQDLLAKVERQSEQIDILREASDKKSLGRVEALRSQGKLVKSVNINTYDGKIIIGWKKIKDDVYFDEQGRLHEDQIVGLIFEGETKVGKELDIRSFSRLTIKVLAEVTEESKDRDGNTNLVIEMKDGKTFKIDSRFVN